MRFATFFYADKVRSYGKSVWLVIMHANAILPALSFGVLFSLSLVNPAYEPVFLYLLMTFFALLSGGIVNFTPRPDLSFSFLISLLVPPLISTTLLSSGHTQEAFMLIAYGTFMFVLSRRHNQEYEQLIAQKSALEKLNQQDSLTGIANRRSFDERFKLDWAVNLRGQTQLSLVLIDIDHFKNINDSFGHAAGDAVIKAVADAIQQICKRESDSVARISGEEFAVLLPLIEAKRVADLAEQIRALVAPLVVHHDNQTIKLTVSLGAATCIPQSQASSESLFKLADKSLYRAKALGRNRVECESQGSHETLANH